MRLIDCDVHGRIGPVSEILPYLDRNWRDYMTESGVDSVDTKDYPASSPLAGSPDVTDAGVLAREHLDRNAVDRAVLVVLSAVPIIHNAYYAAALARAVNRYLAERWLADDERLRGSLVVAPQDPQAAAEEIAHWAHDERFVQVLLPVLSRMPYGKKAFWPIYAAAADAGMPVALHAGSLMGDPPTAVGWPSTHAEDYVAQASAFQSQLMSLVTEGVFHEHPALRVVLAESGFTWLPALMWRLDKNWKGLRREVPWITGYPSDVMREHIRLTVAPADAPDDARQILDVVDQLGADEMLLYATDFPHEHGEPPPERWIDLLAPDRATKVRSASALATYRGLG